MIILLCLYRRMIMSSKRKLISTLMCVGALTAGLFVSGCGSERQLIQYPLQYLLLQTTKSDEKSI